ncbi:MAG: hypothetical protein OXF01_17835, partial [Gemmatimonadetes bacterium]|nr:hypothetical protein [Gemmatimonadota bacterium]
TSEDFQQIPLPETFPAFAAATADLVDHLWVREYELPGEGGPNPVWTARDSSPWTKLAERAGGRV